MISACTKLKACFVYVVLFRLKLNMRVRPLANKIRFVSLRVAKKIQKKYGNFTLLFRFELGTDNDSVLQFEIYHNWNMCIL